MKKKFAKFFVLALSLVMTFCATFVFAGCGSTPKEKQIMSLSVNPGIEFVLDEDDKVLSVTASNEDGAYILENFTQFTGMSAKDAALKFIELSEEYGFVVSGTLTGESVTISVSGEGAQKLYDDVKGKIEDKITELGLAVNDMVEITQTQLKDMVEQCYQEYSSAQIDEFSAEEILSLIEQSRKETEGIYLEQDRVLYYMERARKTVEGKIDAIKDFVEQNPSVANLTVTPLIMAMDSAYALVNTAYDLVENQLQIVFDGINQQTSAYAQQKQEYLDAVEQYRDALEANADSNLENNLSDAQIQVLKDSVIQLKNQSKTLYNTLDSARQDFQQQVLELVQTTVHTQMQQLNVAIDAVLEKIELSAQTIQQEINSQINDLKQEFEDDYVSPWQN